MEREVVMRVEAVDKIEAIGKELGVVGSGCVYCLQ